VRVIFLGTPDFGIPALKNILNSNHELVAVVSQPDRVNARNNKVIYSPVKQFAIDNNLLLYQFENISKEGVNILLSLNADIMVTAAYGQILSREILDICPYGVINIHASILPKYRGSSPIQAALLNGDDEIGVTIMQTELEVDAGDIIKIMKYPLKGYENAGECFDILSNLGGKAVVEALDEIVEGRAKYIKQDHSKATFTKKLKKQDGQLNFASNANSIINQIRAFSPWPSAYIFTSRERLIVHKANIIKNDVSGKIGEVLVSQNELIIKCKDYALSIEEVQGEGAKRMDIASYLRGKPIEKGSVITYVLESK
jgi:methionyl-tRNA formyltransferase